MIYAGMNSALYPYAVLQTERMLNLAGQFEFASRESIWTDIKET